MAVNYREEVLRTANASNTGYEDMAVMGALGLVGEAGEVADLIKKEIYHGKQVTTYDLINELSDVRWYLEYLCIALGVTIEEVEQANVAKLRKRYPNGFNVEAANERKDEKTSV